MSALEREILQARLDRLDREFRHAIAARERMDVSAPGRVRLIDRAVELQMDIDRLSKRIRAMGRES